MSDQSMNPITEDDIANYLANTPDFFERHAELLASVQLSSPHGTRAVSLQERESAKRLARMGGAQPALKAAPRRRTERQV